MQAAVLLSAISPEAPLEDSAPIEVGLGRELVRDTLTELVGLGSLLVMLPLASDPTGDRLPRDSLGFCGGVITT